MNDILIQIYQGINDILELRREIQAIILGVDSYHNILDELKGEIINCGIVTNINLLFGYPIKIFPPTILPERYIGFRLKSLL